MKKLWVFFFTFLFLNAARFPEKALAAPVPSAYSSLESQLEHLDREIKEKLRLLDPAQSILPIYRPKTPHFPGLWIADRQGRVKRYSAEKVKAWQKSALMEIASRKISVGHQWETIQNKWWSGGLRLPVVAAYRQTGIIEFRSDRLFWAEAREFFETLLQMALTSDAFDPLLLVDAASIFLSAQGIPHRIVDKAFLSDRAAQKVMRPEEFVIEILSSPDPDAQTMGYYPVVKTVKEIRTLQRKIEHTVSCVRLLKKDLLPDSE